MPAARNRARPGGLARHRRAVQRRRRVAALAAIVLVVAVVVLLLTGSSTKPLGYDVSFPQCSGSLPSSPKFGIVGANAGLARNINPCLAKELNWAEQAPGQKRPAQTNVSLYINTGNPGLQSKLWPTHGTTPAYAKCNGQLTDACSYLYGEQRAEASYRAVAGHDAQAAKTAPWWLDVELQSSWAKTYELNIAALQGFIAGLHTAGATGPVGIYSTAAQWKDLTGLTAQSTPTSFNGGLPDWIAGTEATLSQARANCTSGGFTGSAPTLAQYQLNHQDADVRCGATQ